jgi:proton-dependent oligopeptide transporter, POT family
MFNSTFSKHPAGLPYLFFTELWERFGYYLMIGIFVLYLEDTEKGGLGLLSKESADIYGTFIALNYLTPFIGGMLADRLLGYRKSIIIGGTLMGIGYCMLAIPGTSTFWAALFVMVIGNGFFKPNISTLLGNLYNDEKYRSEKDTGFNIFYMGINIGAFVCNFVAAYMRNTYGWGYAFAAAGIGMFIGVIVFIIGNKHYEHADQPRATQPGEQSVAVVLSSVMVPAIITGVIGWFIPGNIFGSDSTDAFLLGCLPIIAFYLNVWRTATADERRPISALLSIYAVVIIFWAVFKQNGTALTKWAEYYTDREVPTMLVKPLQTFGMVQTINGEIGMFTKYSKEFKAEKGADGKAVKDSITHPYFINAADKLPAKGSSISLYNTELFQSINPFFVVLLTPFVIGFFANLRKRKREPSTAGKIGWGLIISSLSSIVMIVAVIYCHNGLEKSSAWWLVAMYGATTVGELCLSPMGLSLVSKLAPVRIAALMMGGWQLSTAIGNKLSGVLASMWDSYPDKSYFFGLNMVLTAIAAVAIFIMMPRLNAVIEEYVQK